MAARRSRTSSRSKSAKASTSPTRCRETLTAVRWLVGPLLLILIALLAWWSRDEEPAPQPQAIAGPAEEPIAPPPPPIAIAAIDAGTIEEGDAGVVAAHDIAV